MERAHLLRHETTFAIGGPAEYFTTVISEEDVRGALADAERLRHSHTLLAGGSNVLIADEGVSGVVMCMRGGLLKTRGTNIHVQCGASLYEAIRETAADGLGGWERLSGIPGTVGGAIRGNAGAFGTEIGEVLLSVRALDRHTGHVREFKKDACAFSYRYSYFKKHPEWILLDAVFALRETDTKESTTIIEETVAEREKRHLQHVRAAGSFFVNPVAPSDVAIVFASEKHMEARAGRVPAGWLIEKVGMRGEREGGAASSQMHANYLVNDTGEATAADVWKLAQRIATKVKAQYAVELSPEVTVMGSLDAFPPLV